MFKSNKLRHCCRKLSHINVMWSLKKTIMKCKNVLSVRQKYTIREHRAGQWERLCSSRGFIINLMLYSVAVTEISLGTFVDYAQIHLLTRRGVEWWYLGCVSEHSCCANGIWCVLLCCAPLKGYEKAARKKVASWPFPRCCTLNKLQNQREKENEIVLFLRSCWTCSGESVEQVRRAQGGRGGETLQQDRHCRA